VVTRTESNSGRSTSSGCLFVEVEANVLMPLFVNYSVMFQDRPKLQRPQTLEVVSFLLQPKRWDFAEVLEI